MGRWLMQGLLAVDAHWSLARWSNVTFGWGRHHMTVERLARLDLTGLTHRGVDGGVAWMRRDTGRSWSMWCG